MYWKLQYKRALDIMEDPKNNIYTIDKLFAMKYITGIWEEMGEKVLNNYWRKTILLRGSSVQDTDTEPASRTSDERELLEVLSNRVVPDARMSIHALLNNDDFDYHE